jgi:TetR/AcrR family transcriptional repressor of nem operon
VGRPKQFDPDAAVTTAMNMFWSHGYGATTPAGLTDALGIGKGSLYNTFDSKHALFEQALRRYGDHRVAGLIAALRRPGPVKPLLRAALERIAIPEQAEQRRRGCMAVNTATELGERDEAASAIVRDVFDRMEAALAAAIEEGQLRGEIDAALDARAVAGLFLTTMLGMTVIGRSGDPSPRLKRVVRALMSML